MSEHTAPAEARLQQALEHDPIAAAQLEALSRLAAAIEQQNRELDSLNSAIRYGFMLGCWQ